MIGQKISADAGIQITVTTTATSLADLIDTAASAAQNFDGEINAIDLCPEGEIRYAFQNTPTTAIGMILGNRQTRTFRGYSPKDVMLIASANTLVNVQVGRNSYD